MTKSRRHFPDYHNRPVALLTRHQKGDVIAPVLAQLGLEVRVTDSFDTDKLGTFSGEVPRTLSPLECARRKAQLACEHTGLDLGLGSEGSFGGGPLPGLMNWDEELLVLVDQSAGLEVIAVAAGPVKLSQFEPQSLSDVRQRLSGYSPEQGWILKYPDQVYKGLVGPSEVASRLEALDAVTEDGHLRAELQGKVTVEPDLRAMHCPQRRDYIGKASQQLLERLRSNCPACGAPDFWQRETERGLPCAWCAEPTELPLAHISRCLHCGHALRQAVPQGKADPGNCSFCNP